MNENNEKVVKQKSNKGVIIVLIILLMGAIGYIAYDKFIAKDTKPVVNETTDTTTKEETKNDTTTVEAKTEDVPITDLVHLYYDASDRNLEIIYAYINNGKLYYYTDKQEKDGTPVGAFKDNPDFTSSYYVSSGNSDKNVKEYNSITNIKRLKLFNEGTGINPTFFLITEEGKVYYSSIYGVIFKGETFDFKEVEGLKNYKVEDILNMDGEKENIPIEVKLQDGTITTVNW